VRFQIIDYLLRARLLTNELPNPTPYFVGNDGISRCYYFCIASLFCHFLQSEEIELQLKSSKGGIRAILREREIALKRHSHPVLKKDDCAVIYRPELEANGSAD
jgi:hypothetical protein